MQAQSQGAVPAQGMFSSFAAIFRAEGLSGLYRVNLIIYSNTVLYTCRVFSFIHLWQFFYFVVSININITYTEKKNCILIYLYYS